MQNLLITQNRLTRGQPFWGGILAFVLLLWRKFFSLCRILNDKISPNLQIIRHVLNRNKIPMIQAWCSFSHGKLNHRNWGDDINKFFFEESTGEKISIYPKKKSLFQVENIVAIGSFLGECNEKSIVWGSGLLNNVRYLRLKARPRKILAVRGSLTRQWLLKQGMDCPQVFGDPALLLPLFYEPRKIAWGTDEANGANGAKIGIVGHYEDIERHNEALQKLVQNKNTRLIRVSGYEDWHDFIDEIASCDLVVSASLHGLIVSEAYCVPSAWVEFCEHATGWDFKSQDFYTSIGKAGEKKISLNGEERMGDLLPIKERWRRGKFDFRPLLKVCPLPIKESAIIRGNMGRYIYH